MRIGHKGKIHINRRQKEAKRASGNVLELGRRKDGAYFSGDVGGGSGLAHDPDEA
jgi:hypothetical protein